MHKYRYFVPCSNAIFANGINQTNATSGFYPVAFFKLSMRYNQWSRSNKSQQNLYWRPHIYYVWKLEQNTKNKLQKNCVEKNSDYFFTGVYTNNVFFNTNNQQMACNINSDKIRILYTS